MTSQPSLELALAVVAECLPHRGLIRFTYLLHGSGTIKLFQEEHPYMILFLQPAEHCRGMLGGRSWCLSHHHTDNGGHTGGLLLFQTSEDRVTAIYLQPFLTLGNLRLQL